MYLVRNEEGLPIELWATEEEVAMLERVEGPLGARPLDVAVSVYKGLPIRIIAQGVLSGLEPQHEG